MAKAQKQKAAAKTPNSRKKEASGEVYIKGIRGHERGDKEGISQEQKDMQGHIQAAEDCCH